MFYDILEGRNAFLDYENKKFKKLKNWDFSKGVSPWWFFIREIKEKGLSVFTPFLHFLSTQPVYTVQGYFLWHRVTWC